MSTWYDYFWGNTQTVVADNMSNGVDTTPIGLTGQLDFKSQIGFSSQVTSGPQEPKFPSVNDASKVIAKLNKMGLPGQLFFDQLIKCKAVLAGSFPMQCVLNEDYAGSNIDIFIGNDSGDLETWIKDNLVEKGDKLKLKGHMCFIDILSSQTYDLPSQGCLNLVRVNTPDLKTYVNDHFDLNFCQVTFDGKILEIAVIRFVMCTYSKKPLKVLL